MPTFAVYGITLTTTWEFSWPLVPSDRPADLTFSCATEPPPGVEVRDDGAVPIEGDSLEDAPISFHPGPGYDVVRVSGVADHYVWPDRIVCHLREPSRAHLVEIQLLGVVLALWLERRGVPTLHASVVAISGRAVAFLGVPGGGKTTAAAALIAAGHELLVDDLVATRIDGDRVMVDHGYPLLRLWPAQADHFLGSHTEYPRLHPFYDKRLVAIGERFGRFRAAATPLARIYLPQRHLEDHEARIEPVASGEALLTLVANSFLHEAVHRLGLAGARLPYLSSVLSRTPPRRLRYPSGFDRLPELVDAVTADLTTAD